MHQVSSSATLLVLQYNVDQGVINSYLAGLQTAADAALFNANVAVCVIKLHHGSNFAHVMRHVI